MKTCGSLAPAAAGTKRLTVKGCQPSVRSSRPAAIHAVPRQSPTTQPPVEAILFDMDGVLCNSEGLSRTAAVQAFKELYGVSMAESEFVPFMGTGENNFLNGPAKARGISIDLERTKAKFFELYINTYAQPGAGIGYPGAIELVRACKKVGLKTAVASSAERVKVNANLVASGFDAAADFDIIVSADLFKNIKPAPDIFLAAAKEVKVDPTRCVVIEDAAAGVQAARSAGMRCVGVTTTLSQAEMAAEGPDAVLPDISHITLQLLQRVKYT